MIETGEDGENHRNPRGPLICAILIRTKTSAVTVERKHVDAQAESQTFLHPDTVLVHKKGS